MLGTRMPYWKEFQELTIKDSGQLLKAHAGPASHLRERLPSACCGVACCAAQALECILRLVAEIVRSLAGLLSQLCCCIIRLFADIPGRSTRLGGAASWAGSAADCSSASANPNPVRPELVEACPERLPQAGSRRGLHFFNHRKKGSASTGSVRTAFTGSIANPAAAR